MAKILTGIQSTGTPHLGNILGAIIPAVQMANSTDDESYLFIANMHSFCYEGWIKSVKSR